MIHIERFRLRQVERGKVKSVATDNATVLKASAGEMTACVLTNSNAAARFIKFYDKATAPTSADTPAFTLRVPASGQFGADWTNGLKFSVGIAYRVTTGAAENDNTAPGADEVLGVVGYV